MSEESVTTPLIQRLAVERLAAPGILDHRRLQRASARVGAPSPAPMLNRLMRRVEATTRSAEGLLLARGQSVAETGGQTQHDVATAGSISGSEPAAPGDRLLARKPDSGRDRVAGQAASATNAGDFGAGSHVAPPVDASSQVRRVGDTRSSVVRDTQTSFAGARPLAPMTFAPRVVMRRAEPIGFAGAMRAARGAAHQAAPHAPSLALAGEPGAASEAAIAHGSTGAHRSSSQRSSGAQGSGPPDLAVARDALAPALHDSRAIGSRVSQGASMTTAAPIVASTAAPLVFRKVAAAAPASPAARPSIASTIVKTPAATNVVARAAAAPDTTEDGEAALSPAPDSKKMDLEWLTQQVSARLARRLEIERERLGVRPWRQSSF